MDPVWSLLLLLRPWIGYDHIVIQVVCWVELPEQRRLLDFLRVDGLSTEPPGLGHHILVLEHRYTNT